MSDLEYYTVSVNACIYVVAWNYIMMQMSWLTIIIAYAVKNDGDGTKIHLHVYRVYMPQDHLVLNMYTLGHDSFFYS